MTKKENLKEPIKKTATSKSKLEQQSDAVRYLEEYSKTKDIKYLRLAIKKYPDIFFLDDRMRDWIYEIRYKASIPHPGKEYKDAQEFMDELRLLKPEKQGEIYIFFGSGYHFESCLGIRFVLNTKPKLRCYDNAALIVFVNELKHLWGVYHTKKQIYKFKDLSHKRKLITEFCETLGLKISKDDLNWGSIYTSTDIALTVLGIANMKRFKLLLSNYPKHELNKYAGKYFSFHTLQYLYKKIKRTVNSNDVKKVSSVIKTAKNQDNPFTISYEGMPSYMFLAHPRSTYIIVEKGGRIRESSYLERINLLKQKSPLNEPS